MEADGLFVYGSLREGGRRHRWLLCTGPEGACRAWSPGRLFHLPSEGWPALLPGEAPAEAPPGPGWVAGEFVGYAEPEELEAALADLDALEGVAEGLFARRLVPVALDSGHRFSAWAYVFPEERLPRLLRDAVELIDGDWAPYVDG